MFNGCKKVFCPTKKIKIVKMKSGLIDGGFRQFINMIIVPN